MKNTFLKTAAGLFAAILLGAFVLSCEGPAGSNGSSGTIIPQVTQIADAAQYYDVGYDTVRLVVGDEVGSGNYGSSIPDGKTLLVAAGVELTVDNVPLTLGENATLQLEDGAGIIFVNAAVPSGAETVTTVFFGPGAKIAGSEGVESISAGANGGALLLKEAVSATMDTLEAGTSLWSAGGKIALAKTTHNAGLLTTSTSQTDGEAAGTAENDLSASNGLKIEGVAIDISGIVAEGVLAAPSAANSTFSVSTKSLKSFFDLANADNPELVITNRNMDGSTGAKQLFTYEATTLNEGITVYVPVGKTLYLTNEVARTLPIITAANADGKKSEDVAYTINGDIKVSGSVEIGGRGDAVASMIAGGGNVGGVTVKGSGSIELLKDANGTQLGKIYVTGAGGGVGGETDTLIGVKGGDVKVLVAIDGDVSGVAGGAGGNNATLGGAAGGASTAKGGNGGDVYVNANVNGTVKGGAGADGVKADTAGVLYGDPGVGGNVYILGDVRGTTVQKEIKVAPDAGDSNGTLQGGAAGSNIGGTNGLTIAGQANPGKVYAAKSVYAVKEDGTDVEAVTDATDGFEITNAKGTTGSSLATAGVSAAGGAGGDVIISGEATYIVLP